MSNMRINTYNKEIFSSFQRYCQISDSGTVLHVVFVPNAQLSIRTLCYHKFVFNHNVRLNEEFLKMRPNERLDGIPLNC